MRRVGQAAPMNIRNWSRLATRRKGLVRFCSPIVLEGSLENRVAGWHRFTELDEWKIDGNRRVDAGSMERIA